MRGQHCKNIQSAAKIYFNYTGILYRKLCTGNFVQEILDIKKPCTTENSPDPNSNVSDLPPPNPESVAEASEKPEEESAAAPKPASLSGRIWKKLGFAGAVKPKKAKTEPEEPTTIEEVIEEEEGEEKEKDKQDEKEDDGGAESVAIEMEVVPREEEATPEVEMAGTGEEECGDQHQQQHHQPRRSLEMIREEQEDEVKVQYANVHG